jgi:hypothetical protein
MISSWLYALIYEYKKKRKEENIRGQNYTQTRYTPISRDIHQIGASPPPHRFSKLYLIQLAESQSVRFNYAFLL